MIRSGVARCGRVARKETGRQSPHQTGRKSASQRMSRIPSRNNADGSIMITGAPSRMTSPPPSEAFRHRLPALLSYVGFLGIVSLHVTHRPVQITDRNAELALSH